MDPRRTRVWLGAALIAMTCASTACIGGTQGSSASFASSPMATSTSQGASPSSDTAADGRRDTGRLLIGLGAGEIVVATIFALMAGYENREASQSCPELGNDCSQARARRDGARSSSIVSVVAAALGVLALAGGIVLVSTSPVAKSP